MSAIRIYKQYSYARADEYLFTSANHSDALALVRSLARERAAILDLPAPDFSGNGDSGTVWIDRPSGTFERYYLRSTEAAGV